MSAGIFFGKQIPIPCRTGHSLPASSRNFSRHASVKDSTSPSCIFLRNCFIRFRTRWQFARRTIQSSLLHLSQAPVDQRGRELPSSRSILLPVFCRATKTQIQRQPRLGPTRMTPWASFRFCCPEPTGGIDQKLRHTPNSMAISDRSRRMTLSRKSQAELKRSQFCRISAAEGHSPQASSFSNSGSGEGSQRQSGGIENWRVQF